MIDAGKVIALGPAVILERADKIKWREYSLSSTVNFSRFCGDNPWDFDRNEPRWDEETGFYPWCPYAEQQCDYLDSRAAGIAKPIKPVFVARSHFKTTFIATHMAKYSIQNPEKLSGVIADTDPKAQMRVMNINEILMRDHVNKLFDDRLFSSQKQVKDHYSNSATRLKRKRDAGQPTIAALGIFSKIAGYHFNGKAWFDDLVNEENYKNEEIQWRIWLKLQQFIRYVCDPGCEIIISGTRYSMTDAYDYILSDSSPLHKDIAEGFEVMGCTDDDGKPLNFMKFCVSPKDKEAPVNHRGVTFHPIRASLEEEKAATHPKSEWYAQMENNPTDAENALFNEKDFRQVIPCKSTQLHEFLGDKVNVEVHIDRLGDDTYNGTPCLPLRQAILGDIAYSARAHNDFSIILVTTRDSRNNIYLMDGWRKKTDRTMIQQYFKEVFIRRAKYHITEPMGIEVHAKESSVPLAEMVAAQMGVASPVFHPLTKNSHIRKTERIEPLATIAAEGRIYVCSDFPPDVLDALCVEAQTFPNGKRDDTLDTLANILQVLSATPFKKRRGRKKVNRYRRVPPGVAAFLR